MSIIFDRAVEYYDETRGFPPGQEIPAAALVARVGKMSAQSRVLEAIGAACPRDCRRGSFTRDDGQIAR
jgi:hypothetical protein